LIHLDRTGFGWCQVKLALHITENKAGGEAEKGAEVRMRGCNKQWCLLGGGSNMLS
jgi:hypothetical protein